MKAMSYSPASDYLSIDETEAKCSPLDDSGIQKNLTQISQHLTQSLLAGHPTFGNTVLSNCPGSNCLKPMATLDKGQRSRLPVFQDLGVNDCMSGPFSLVNKGQASDGRIETNTSEYFSEETRNSTDHNSNSLKSSKTTQEEKTAEEDVKPRRHGSSSNEDIQTKRASLVKSKDLYSSFEFDSSRRGSLLVGCHGDSVFSDEVLPSTQRRRSRERLVKQRSQSTSDLPDLIQSSTSPNVQSPDVVPRVSSEECLVEQDNQVYIRSINERVSLERKEQIEGRVHDGISRKSSFKRSVSFQESPTVFDIPGQEDSGNCEQTNHPPCSPKGAEGRQFYRDLKSSGYGTGSSSKNSLQSQLSDQTNLSDSVLTDHSVDQDDVEELDTLTNLPSDKQADGLPFLSIFDSSTSQSVTHTHSIKGRSLKTDGPGDSLQNSTAQKPAQQPRDVENLPCLSMFQSTGTSNGSLVLKSGELQGMGDVEKGAGAQEDLNLARKEPEESPSLLVHDNYADKVLEARLNKKPCECDAQCPVKNECQKRSLTKDARLYHHASDELFEQFCLQNHDPESLLAALDKVLVPSDSSTPSPSPKEISPNSLQRFLAAQPLSPKEMPGMSNERPDIRVNERLKEILERSSRCYYNKCDDPDCRKAKSLLHGFEESVRSNSSLDAEQNGVLFALRCHSERCENMKCSVPYCDLLLKVDPWDLTEAILRIHQHLDTFLTVVDSNTTPTRFLALSEDCLHQDAVREGEDWIALTPLGNTRSAALIQDFNASSPGLYVLKKMPLLEENHQWHVYKQMRQLSHPHIVKHLWVMEQGSDFLICTQFMEAGNLRQMLQEGKSKLPWKQIVGLMQQVITGVRALHDRDIVYINWTSTNILLLDSGRVKVSNLSMSVNVKSSDNIDFGGIKNTLPPAILPPELLAGRPTVYPVSDSWGCGCLLYELLLGHKVWYQYRHENKDYIWKKLQGKVPPTPRLLLKWPDVFQAVWKHDYRMRGPLNHVSRLLDLTLTGNRS